MKKLLILVLIVLAIAPFEANARLKSTNHFQRGGFVGDAESTTFTNVTDVENLADETYVTLKGNILSKVGHEKYSFKDTTGTIVVEIDDDDWHGVVVKPTDVVILEGEVDKHFMKPTEVEVDRVRIEQ